MVYNYTLGSLDMTNTLMYSEYKLYPMIKTKTWVKMFISVSLVES